MESRFLPFRGLIGSSGFRDKASHGRARPDHPASPPPRDRVERTSLRGSKYEALRKNAGFEIDEGADPASKREIPRPTDAELLILRVFWEEVE